MQVGLFYTFASVFQMLRGTLVIFAGLLTIVVLKRRLHVHHWFGIVLITAGAALVGASRWRPCPLVKECDDAQISVKSVIGV